MIIHHTIEFDEQERVQIVRALAGIVGPDDEGDRNNPNVMRRFLHSVEGRERFDAKRLDSVSEALIELSFDLLPQADAAWWRAAGAPVELDGGRGIEGLAQERSHQLNRLEELRRLIAEACSAAGPRLPHRKEVGV